jgi:AI-2 transport protein TqsA
LSGIEFSREQGLLITGSLVLLATVAASFALWWASSVAVPFVMALLVTYLVLPIVDALQLRLRAPRWVAILAAFLVLIAGGALLTVLVTTSIADLLENGATYEVSVRKVAYDLVTWLDSTAQRFGAPARSSELDPVEALLQAVNLDALLSTVGVGTANLLGSVSSFTANAAMVLIFAVIIIAGRKPMETREGLWGEIDSAVRRYLGLKFAASAATGLLTWLFLYLLGVPLSLVFGVLAFFLNFIPSVGSLIAMVLPLPVAYLAFADQPLIWIGALVLPGSIQFVVGNIIEPYFQGDSLDLHPITVLLTLIFWTLLWGVAGAIISVPITSVIKMVLARFETTRPVAELLAGRLGAEALTAAVVPVPPPRRVGPPSSE